MFCFLNNTMITTFSKPFINRLQINIGDLWLKVSYGHSGNKAVISSYSDLAKLSPLVSEIHFRKFVSQRLLLEVLSVSNNLRKISMSKSAYSRCNNLCLDALKQRSIEVKISGGLGRPSLMEMILW